MMAEQAAQSFRDLVVWQKAHAFVLAAYRLLGVDPYLSQFLGVPTYTGVAFLGARYYAFRAPATLAQEA